jgi:DNA integrity scanning protein DisA with diadenylate cyclase activity
MDSDAKEKQPARSLSNADHLPDKTGHPLTTKFLEYALYLALTTDAAALLVYADVFQKSGSLERFIAECERVEVVLATRDAALFEECKSKHSSVLIVPPIRLNRAGQVKMAMLLGFARGLFKEGDRIVCLTGVADSGVLDTVMYVETQEEFEMFASSLGRELTDGVRPEVFECLLGIAVELGNEGREGKPVGVTFVIGDLDDVQEHSRQMVLNPFRGYPREQRNVLTPELNETLKEFAAIDGAFIVTGDGIVLSAGSYLRPQTAQIELLPSGFGARHAAAAGITACTNALAVTVSESTGMVTLFKNGVIMMTLSKPVVQDRGMVQKVL